MTTASAGDELYGLDPDEFTVARNALAKELRTGGDKEAATAVAGRRRPPVTAWALNRVARQVPDLVGHVLEAGAGLRAAMDAAVSGDASELRPARAREREAVDAAVTRALDELRGRGQGNPEALGRRLEATLRAAVLDPAAADALRRGVLDRDLDAPGLGLEGLSATPAAKRPASKGPDPEQRAERRQLERTVQRLTTRADQLERAATRAADAAQEAREAARAAADELAEATRKLASLG